MKRLLLILAMCGMLLPTFVNAKSVPSPGKDPSVIVVEVTKTGGHFSNLFNLYGIVTTTYNYNTNPVQATLTCTGGGYARCKLASETPVVAGTIGSANHNSISSNSLNSRDLDKLLSNPAVTRTINELIDLSESSCNRTKGVNKGFASKKVAISESKSTRMLLFNAEWNYDSNREGKMRISIAEAPANLISTRTR